MVPKLDESLLTRVPPFRKLSRAQIREILDAAQTHRFDGGTAVFTEGQPVDRFYLLLDGHVRVQRTTPGGDQVIVLHIGPGQLFGIGAALGHRTYPATAFTAHDCVALSWPNRLWPAFIARYDGFAAETYRVVGQRIAEMQDMIADIATKHVEERIAGALLRLSAQMGRPVADGIEIGFPITRQNISDMTGTTLHTVSRLLSAWEKDGIVASERRRITVTAPHRLEAIRGTLN
jgi:CRP-like cAMP-binding protein